MSDESNATQAVEPAASGLAEGFERPAWYQAPAPSQEATSGEAGEESSESNISEEATSGTGEGEASAGAEGGAAEEAKETEDEQPQKRQIKVNGEMRELTDDELERAASLGLARGDAIREMREMQRAIQQVETNLEAAGLLGYFRDGQFDRDRFIDDHIVRRVEEGNLSEDERALRRAKAEREREEAMAAELRQQREQQQEAEENQVAIANYQRAFSKAMHSAGLPMTDDVVQLMFLEAANMVTEDNPDPDPDAVAASLWSKYSANFGHHLNSVSEDMDALERMLGQERVDALIKHRMGKIKAASPAANRSGPVKGNGKAENGRPKREIRFTDDIWDEWQAS